MIQLAEAAPRAPASARIASIKLSVIAGMIGDTETLAWTPALESASIAASLLAGAEARGSSVPERRGSRLVTEIETAVSSRCGQLGQQVEIAEDPRRLGGDRDRMPCFEAQL